MHELLPLTTKVLLSKYQVPGHKGTVITHPLKNYRIQIFSEIKWFTVSQIATEAKLLIKLKHSTVSDFHSEWYSEKAKD